MSAEGVMLLALSTTNGSPMDLRRCSQMESKEQVRQLICAAAVIIFLLIFLFFIYFVE